MAVLKESKYDEEDKSHWYCYITGDAVHEVPYADKKRREAGETRPTTLRDARKLRLCRSTTNFLGQLRKPQLEKWIIGQVIKAAEANPRNPNEDDWMYQKRVTQASRTIVEAASSYGTFVHNLIAVVLESGGFNTKPWLDEYAPEIHSSAAPILTWLKSNKINIRKIEKTYINQLQGYGGTTDLIFDSDDIRGVFDFKSRRTIPDQPLQARDGQAMQLASYGSCHYWGGRLPTNMDQVRILSTGKWAIWGANLYFSTTELGRFDIVWYPPSVMAAEGMAYYHLLEMQKFQDKWDPCDPDRYKFIGKSSSVNVIKSNMQVTDLAASLRDSMEEKLKGSKAKVKPIKILTPSELLELGNKAKTKGKKPKPSPIKKTTTKKVVTLPKTWKPAKKAVKKSTTKKVPTKKVEKKENLLSPMEKRIAANLAKKKIKNS